MTAAATLNSVIIADFSVRLPGSKHEAGSFDLRVDERLPGAGVTVVFGASGCGKTTLLRALAGLQPIESGYLRVKGETWHDEKESLPAHRRPVGYVFQEASLFEHLTAAGNLEFARKRAAATVNEQEVQDVIALLGLGDLLQQRPQQLSGGERQRLSIARSLLIKPELLLMDEPLAALDQTRKQEILPYLDRIRAELKIPMIYVTHALDEVTRLADHLMILSQGRVRACGPIREVLARIDVPGILGEEAGAIVEGRVTERDSEWRLIRVDFEGGQLWLRDSGEAMGQQLRVRTLARDISLSLEADQASSILNRLPAEVAAIAEDADPAMALVQLVVGAPGETRLVARISRRSVAQLALSPGKPVWAQIKSVAVLY
ncbi:MAG TPA: molybdenum ABC transporter ATP-binding protein [Gammaproteobacteria bacterium]|nr:molybdenum ABC transporter ATP-binding protein [Gammaproteobacteria bacterium]